MQNMLTVTNVAIQKYFKERIYKSDTKDRTGQGQYTAWPYQTDSSLRTCGYNSKSVGNIVLSKIIHIALFHGGYFGKCSECSVHFTFCNACPLMLYSSIYISLLYNLIQSTQSKGLHPMLFPALPLGYDTLVQVWYS